MASSSRPESREQERDSNGSAPPSHKARVEAAAGAPRHSETKDEQYIQDVRTAFAGVPRLRPQWVDKYMTILVVGESGLGKTTFIQNMFAAYAQNSQLPVNDASSPTAKEDFVGDPDKLCTEIVVRDQHNQIAFHYRVQDSPGYDNMEVNMDPILDYINNANLTFLRREQDARRDGPLSRLPDPRVDVCVYFIAPHRLKPVDCKFIAEVAKLVPVIPVLAKADSMTSTELSAFRRTVSKSLTRVGKDEGRSMVWESRNELLREAGVHQEAPPFAIVCSAANDLSVGNFWPVREYPWGRCEALSSKHSDMPALKKLLFEVAFNDLKDATEQRYYAYRERQLLDMDDPTSLMRRVPKRHVRWAPRRGRPLRGLLKRAAKLALLGGLFYAGMAYAAGGTPRLREDASGLRGRSEQAAGAIAHAAGGAAGAAKGAVEERLLSDEERAKREEAKKPPRGPFGIFGRG